MTCLRMPDQRDRLVGEPDAALDRVREVDQPGLAVVDPDVDHLGVEDLAQPVAHEVVHRLHLDLGRQALLDLVDDRELGGPLVGLGEQPLGLVEQARVLERDAHARGERGDDALVARR